MAWVAVDKDGSEGIFRSKPRRMNNWWLDKRYLCVVINVLKSVKSDGAAFLME